MHKYRMLIYRAGATIDIVKCYAIRKKKEDGGGWKKKTPEEIQEANRRQAAKKLERLINANFRPGDLHTTLTYTREMRPDKQTAQNRLKNFLDWMRTRYRKVGKEFRYIVATEYERKAIHHHIILNNINDGKETSMDYIRKYWKPYGHPKFSPLYDDAEYSQLADYLIKETDKTFRNPESPVKQRYSHSRNLVQPKVTRRDVETKRGWEKGRRPGRATISKKTACTTDLTSLGMSIRAIPWSNLTQQTRTGRLTISSR